MQYEEQMAPLTTIPPLRYTQYAEVVADALTRRRIIYEKTLHQLATTESVVIATAAEQLITTLRRGNKVLVIGNGGSAAEAQHFAAELIGRFKRERAPFAVLALTSDSAALTALANDYGFQNVFARQVLGLGKRGDLLLAFSTSGESENLVRAAAAAHKQAMTVLAITGERQSRLAGDADITLRVPLGDTATIQEMHMLYTHILCDIVEQALMHWDGEA